MPSIRAAPIRSAAPKDRALLKIGLTPAAEMKYPAQQAPNPSSGAARSAISTAMLESNAVQLEVSSV